MMSNGAVYFDYTPYNILDAEPSAMWSNMTAESSVQYPSASYMDGLYSVAQNIVVTNAYPDIQPTPPTYSSHMPAYTSTACISDYEAAYLPYTPSDSVTGYPFNTPPPTLPTATITQQAIFEYCKSEERQTVSPLGYLSLQDCGGILTTALSDYSAKSVSPPVHISSLPEDCSDISTPVPRGYSVKPASVSQNYRLTSASATRYCSGISASDPQDCSARLASSPQDYSANTVHIMQHLISLLPEECSGISTPQDSSAISSTQDCSGTPASSPQDYSAKSVSPPVHISSPMKRLISLLPEDCSAISASDPQDCSGISASASVEFSGISASAPQDCSGISPSLSTSMKNDLQINNSAKELKPLSQSLYVAPTSQKPTTNSTVTSSSGINHKPKPLRRPFSVAQQISASAKVVKSVSPPIDSVEIESVTLPLSVAPPAPSLSSIVKSISPT